MANKRDKSPAAAARAALQDPFELWREWLTKSEHQLNSMMNEAMATEQFSKVSARWLEGVTLFQKSMNEASQRYFTTLNFPTRTDMLELAGRMSSIEERLVKIEHLLQRSMDPEAEASSARTRSRPARTRKPPTAAAKGAAAEASPTARRAAAGKKVTKKKAAKKKSSKKKATRKSS